MKIKIIRFMIITFSITLLSITNVFADYCGLDNLSVGTGDTSTTDCSNRFYCCNDNVVNACGNISGCRMISANEITQRQNGGNCSCGCSTSTPTDPESTTPPTSSTSTNPEIPKCYGDTPDIKDATYVFYGKKSTAKYFMARQKDIGYDKVTVYPYSHHEARGNISIGRLYTQDECKITPKEKLVDPCKPDQVPKKELKNDTSYCEEEMSSSYEDDVIRCGDGSISKGYYTIACNTTNTNIFDFGNDGRNNLSLMTLLPGEGFGYKITTKFVKKCTGTFDADLWNHYYNNEIKYYQNASKESEEWFSRKNAIKKLKEIANEFSNWEAKIEDNPTIEVSIDTSPKIVVKNFTSRVINNGTFVKKNGKKHQLSDGTVIYDFEINSSTPREIEYIPPKVELDAKTGQVATTVTTSKVNGGNKIYTDLNVKPGTYNIDIKVNNVKSMKTVSNNKCAVNVLDKKDLLYRIIDVTNPFISEDYEKGSNWKNNQFDYTQVIDKDIWSKNGLYVFNLLKETIQALQKSNGNNIEKYLGTCNLPDSEKDEVTKIICNIINSAKK